MTITNYFQNRHCRGFALLGAIWAENGGLKAACVVDGWLVERRRRRRGRVEQDLNIIGGSFDSVRVITWQTREGQ